MASTSSAARAKSARLLRMTAWYPSHISFSRRMRRELMEELEADTTLEDIAEPYRLVVEMIGLKNVLKLSRYFMGDKIYLPKAERILAPARNRRIRREYNGRNAKELAKEYDLTTNQILQIVRDLDPTQISLFEFLDGESGEAGKR